MSSPQAAPGMTEDELVIALSAWFEGDGYTVATKVTSDPTVAGLPLQTAPGASRAGVDVVADGQGIRWIVEAKGDLSTSASYSVDYQCLIGQIASRMRRRGQDIRYAVAVPWSRVEAGETPNVAAVLRRLANSLLWSDLDLWLLAVRDDGTVVRTEPGQVGVFLSESLA